MNFASVEFWIFLAVFLPAFLACPARFRLPLLLGASWFFYACWKPAFLLLLIFTTVVDFWAGRTLPRLNPFARRTLLFASIAMNLAVLFFFKYETFTATNANALFRYLDLRMHLPLLHLILPLGISFYTFHSISYMVDIYKGRIAPEPQFHCYALYVCFFPLLVAGPIERAGHLLPQFHRPPLPINAARFLGGFTQALFGLWKKVVIADALALHVQWAFTAPEEHSGGTLLLATYLFAFQIYCDFSGYSDIALGTARMLGYDLSENFRYPYFATSLTDFWRRWHISLSTWLRDYLYIPLGGNRGGLLTTCRNLCITMLLGGLWHGAAWTFIIWGGLHGLWLSVEKLLRLPERLERRLSGSGISSWIWRGLAALATFHVVCLGWIFFRAQSLQDALTVLRHLATPHSLFHIEMIHRTTLVYALPQFFLLLAMEALYLRRHPFSSLFTTPLHGNFRWKVPLLLNACLILAVLLFGMEAGSDFIYFQF